MQVFHEVNGKMAAQREQCCLEQFFIFVNLHLCKMPKGSQLDLDQGNTWDDPEEC